jgi:hypothetical protein
VSEEGEGRTQSHSTAGHGDCETFKTKSKVEKRKVEKLAAETNVIG